MAIFLTEQQRIKHSAMQAAIQEVLQYFIDHDGCPCGYKSFVFWAGKPQGPGWHDILQGELVAQAVKLDCYESKKPEQPEYWLAAELTCKVCDTKWKYFCEEWRMLAYKRQLLRPDIPKPQSLFPLVLSDQLFATAGREPDPQIRRFTIEKWVDFMKTGDY